MHHLWSLRCWSYLHPKQGHSSILMHLQQSDPIFNTGVDLMRPAFNLEPKYRVKMLTREEWNRGPVTLPVFKWLIWFTDGSRMNVVTGAGVYGQSLGRRLSISQRRFATVFQTEIYAILACAYEIQFYGRTVKYMGICSNSKTALKVHQAARTSPLVQQCQKVLNDISTQHTAPGHAAVRGNKIADRLARDGSVQTFVGPEPSLGVSKQNIRRKIKCWMEIWQDGEVLVVLRDRFEN